MKTYTKPSINVIELSIEENIAALVPKTVYNKNRNGKLQANSVVEFQDVQYTSFQGTKTV